MSSIIFISVLSMSLLIIHLRYCVTMKMFSYIDGKVVDDNVPKYVYSEMDLMYLNDYTDNTYEEKNDPVCNLSGDKKKALCNLIFESKLYRKTQFYINETAQYLSKLPCKRHRLVLNDDKNINVKKIIMQNMYPCHGRHKIIWTSFIEDFYYNFFYLSSGPSNSVTVYVEMAYRSGYYKIFNYVYNVDLSVLQHVPTDIKVITREINTMKTIFEVESNVQASIIYEQELGDEILNEEDDDPVCSLEYEKKITLCEIIFNSRKLKKAFNIALNKSAAYLYNLLCVTKSVKPSEENTRNIIKSHQKMYPCPVKYISTNYRNEFFLSEKVVNIFFLSSSPRRNAVFVYSRPVFEMEEQVMIIDLIGNIDFKNMKSTVITIEELIAEFKHGYSKMNKIINNVEKIVEKELLSILMSCTTEEQENEMIEQLFFKDAEQKFTNDSESMGESNITGIEQRKKTRIREKKYSRKIISSIDFELGSQVYKRLLQKKKSENLMRKSSLTEKWLDSPKKIVASKELSVGEIEASYFKRIKKEVRKLVAKMEGISAKVIEENLGQSGIHIGSKKLKKKSKERKVEI